MDYICQADDGIRDGHVTGVQTCALPISQEEAATETLEGLGGRLLLGAGDVRERHVAGGEAHLDLAAARGAGPGLRIGRSEERRVGAAARSRRWLDLTTVDTGDYINRSLY